MSQEKLDPKIPAVDRLANLLFKDETLEPYESDRAKVINLNEHERINVHYFANEGRKLMLCTVFADNDEGENKVVLDFSIGQKGLEHIGAGDLQLKFDSLFDSVPIKTKLGIGIEGDLYALAVDEKDQQKFADLADGVVDWMERVFSDRAWLPNIPFEIEVRPRWVGGVGP